MPIFISDTLIANNPTLKRWNYLTEVQRTVITSVLYQYGSPRRVPKFWRHVTNQV